jgi:ABC-type lipoprotein export system ATPase subunit
MDDIESLCSLIKKGNALIEVKGSKAILVVGNTGAGKSTLLHIFARRGLKVEKNEETCEKEILADPQANLPNIKIGIEKTSKKKIIYYIFKH